MIDLSRQDDAARKPFEVSVGDFKRQAATFGWPFWRGVIVGFLGGFPVAYVGMISGSFMGLR